MQNNILESRPVLGSFVQVETPTNSRSTTRIGDSSHLRESRVATLLNPPEHYPGLSSFVPSDSDISLFWSQVTKSNSCWIWKGKMSSGYGYFSHPGGTAFAHRFSYQLHKGRIPKGFFCCHSCDNPACVNPNHLWAGSQSQNMKDMVRKGRGNFLAHDPHNQKLNAEMVIQIRKLYSRGGVTQKQLGIQFGVSLPTINDVTTRRRWQHIE
jgi:hypothetical protein